MSKSEEATVRVFLALELPLSLRTRLATLQSAFAGQAPVKWSSPALLHITVRFLGNISTERLRALCDAAREAAASVPAFTLALAGVGAFPNDRVPRVLWVGIAQDAGYTRLQELFSRTEEALSAHGFSREERAFAPHITLARVRDGATPAERRALGDALRRLKERADVHGTWQVKELIVMRSDLSRSGPTYTPLAVCPLSPG